MGGDTTTLRKALDAPSPAVKRTARMAVAWLNGKGDRPHMWLGYGTPPYRYDFRGANGGDAGTMLKVMLPPDPASLGWGPQALLAWVVALQGSTEDEGYGEVVLCSDRNSVCTVGDTIRFSMEPGWSPIKNEDGEPGEWTFKVPGFLSRNTRRGEKF